MKKIIFFLITIFAILLFGNCDDQFLNNEYKGGDWLYLDNSGAIMPLWVRGNKLSNVFIVYLHGGPGGTSIDSAVSPAHKTLQNYYACVYYDQRGSGTAQGNPKKETFTVEHFVDDLRKIIILIRYKYNNPAIFLMGHSWGGGLGTLFLLDTDNQTFISGWIEVNGGHDLTDGMVLSHEWAVNKVSEKINKGENRNKWEKELSWYNRTVPRFEWNYLERHTNNVEQLNGYFYDSSKAVGMASNLFTSPIASFYFLNNFNMVKNLDLKSFNCTPEMFKITIPSLILWGKHDGILPVQLAHNAYNSLGTNVDDKYLYIFEYSAHSPYVEEPDIFVEKVRTFIEKYR